MSKTNMVVNLAIGIDSAIGLTVRSAIGSTIDWDVRSAVRSAVYSAIDSAIDWDVYSAIEMEIYEQYRYRYSFGY